MSSGAPRPRLAGLLRDAGGALALVPIVEQFPRGQKFLLGDRLQNAALTVLEGVPLTAYVRRRGADGAAAPARAR
jgi:hypothetical protein